MNSLFLLLGLRTLRHTLTKRQRRAAWSQRRSCSSPSNIGACERALLVSTVPSARRTMQLSPEKLTMVGALPNSVASLSSRVVARMLLSTYTVPGATQTEKRPSQNAESIHDVSCHARDNTIVPNFSSFQSERRRGVMCKLRLASTMARKRGRPLLKAICCTSTLCVKGFPTTLFDWMS